MEHAKIDLRDFGVRDHTGERDLWPEDNPHTVPAAFAARLVHSGRAVYHAADPEPDNADPEPDRAGGVRKRSK